MKYFLLFMLALASFQASAQDTWVKGYVWNAASNSGTDVWYGPGNKVTMNGAFARASNAVAASGGMSIAESGTVLLRDGRAVTLTATRFASASALAAAAANLARGPVGLVAVLAIPAVYDWITAEGGQNIRVNGTRTGVEKKDSTVCSVAPCYEYGVGNTNFKPTKDAACRAYAASSFNTIPGAVYYSSSALWCTLVVNGNDTSNYYGFTTRSAAPQVAGWLPASMDDIAPYMTPRLPSTAYPKAITDAGGEIAVTPVSVTGPSPALAPLAPYVQTTTYPKPADQTSTTVASGNPYNLTPGAPSITGTSTGTAPIAPGSTTSSGQLPAGQTAPVPKTINAPTTTTSTSTFNEPANQTTTQTVTKQESHTVTTTVTNVTNITNTTNTSTATTNTTTTTNTTNNTTNTTITNTDVVTPESQPSKEPVPVETCGIPGSGKAPCNVKVDETGTPPDPKLDAAKKVTDTFKPIDDFAKNPKAALPVFPTLNWGFSLPSGCTAISLPAFAPYLQSIDVCQFQPMFHDIMSMVWIIGGLFGAIGAFMRNTFATV